MDFSFTFGRLLILFDTFDSLIFVGVNFKVL